MVSESLRAYAREYASRLPGTHGTHEPEAMGSGVPVSETRLIQSLNPPGTHGTHGTHENDEGGECEEHAPGGGKPFGRHLVGADGEDLAAPGASLVLALWRWGISVAAVNGAVVLTPPPYRQTIPPDLLAACRRHVDALAAWVGAPAGARLVVEVMP